MLRQNRLKQRTRAGEKSIGVWLQSPEPTFCEMAAIAGFDFVIIDNEHGPGSLQNAIAMMRTAMVGVTTPIVRVPTADPIYLKRILDAGAEALLIPMIDTADDARAVVSACHYPPHGQRGNAALAVRASGYGFQEDYVQRASAELMIILQIESVAAIANAREIAAVDGVDMVFIGPADLSGSVGQPGATNAPAVNDLIDQCLAQMLALGMPVGTVPRPNHSWMQLLDSGFQLLTTGSDISFFRQSATAVLKEWRAQKPLAASHGGKSGSSGYCASYDQLPRTGGRGE